MPKTNLGRDKCREDLIALIWGRAAVLGLNDTQLAEKFGMSRTTLLSWKKNPKKGFSIEKLLRVCRVLDIPLDDLRAAIHY